MKIKTLLKVSGAIVLIITTGALYLSCEKIDSGTGPGDSGGRIVSANTSQGNLSFVGVGTFPPGTGEGTVAIYDTAETFLAVIGYRHISGPRYDFAAVGITFGPSGVRTGSFPVDTNSSFLIGFNFDTTSNADSTAYFGTSGTITVSSVSGTNVSGSFSGSALRRQDGDTITVSSGNFNVSYVIGKNPFDGGIRYDFIFIHFASGGTFGGSFTPTTTFPVPLNCYSANFNVNNESPPFPPASEVPFTGPSGSGLSNTPAAFQNFGGDFVSYGSPCISSPAAAPGGVWSVNYKGSTYTFNKVDPQATSRLIIAVPTVTVSSDTLQSVSWIYKNASDTTLAGPPAFMRDIQVQIEGQIGGRIYNSPNLSPSTTNHTLSQTVNWSNVSVIFMAYNDDFENHYVVSFNK